MNIYAGSTCENCGRVARENDSRPYHRCHKCKTRLKPFIDGHTDPNTNGTESSHQTQYRTFFRRVVAGIVDSFVLSILVFPIYYFLDDIPMDYTWIASITTALISPVYFIVLHRKFGQTVGKRLTKIKVLDIGEQRLLTTGKSILRSIVPTLVALFYITVQLLIMTQYWFGYAIEISLYFRLVGILAISFIVLSLAEAFWYLLEIITMLTNRKRRSLHDFLANSVVIRL